MQQHLCCVYRFKCPQSQSIFSKWMQTIYIPGKVYDQIYIHKCSIKFSLLCPTQQLVLSLVKSFSVNGTNIRFLVAQLFRRQNIRNYNFANFKDWNLSTILHANIVVFDRFMRLKSIFWLLTAGYSHKITQACVNEILLRVIESQGTHKNVDKNFLIKFLRLNLNELMKFLLASSEIISSLN